MKSTSIKVESPLNMTQRTIFNEARSAGAKLSKGLTNDQCTFLLLRIAEDLGVRGQLKSKGPEEIAGFFSNIDPIDLSISGIEAESLFAELLQIIPDADTYFHCLATLHKRRIKYSLILETQPIPTIRQVGPRGLLQYGTLGDQSLTAFLFWRKWFFDIDNRAGQETGYIFEPIVARCIGGKPYSSKASPIRRRSDSKKGRQVDCLIGNKAYEIKLRITIAASGQGRWGEEKDFPADCEASGFVPILLVFDDTQADKLDEISKIFIQHKGEVLTGDNAWNHLEEMAGPTISVFLEKYVRGPLNSLLNSAPERNDLPDLLVQQVNGAICITIGNESLQINRPIPEDCQGEDEELTEDEDK